MFERFTNDARAVVVGAQAEARALGHEMIGTPHVLIALLGDPAGPVAVALRGDGVDAATVREELVRRQGTGTPDGLDDDDAAALQSIGIDLDAVRRAVESEFGEGALHLPRESGGGRKGRFAQLFAGGHVPFSRRNKKVLELALREAVRLNQKFIAPEHILLGLLREGEGSAVLILTGRGVDLNRLRDEMTSSLTNRAA